MQSKASNPKEYIESLPEERRKAVAKLFQVIKKNLPPGFKEEMSYGMPGFVVPHSIYPSGYHCDPKLPLPFISLASQKNYISVYHMGLYSSSTLLEWFLTEWHKKYSKKPEMGKGCVRFKKPDDIPYELIGQLASKMTPAQWIEQYEKVIKR